MRWSIRNQLFVPFAVTVMLTVTVIAFASAYLAARRQERQIAEQLDLVVQTLRTAGFPFTSNVLIQMRGLSGSEFVAFDTVGNVRASTLESSEDLARLIDGVPRWTSNATLSEFPILTIDGERYFAARLESPRSPGTAELAVLYPERNLRAARWESAWPSLAVGGITLLVVLGISALLAQRFGRRIGTVRILFDRIAEGDFRPAQIAPPDDEIADLTAAANSLSDQLSRLQETVRQTESVRLLAQLAGGLAHTLRNAATGARLAIQLHQRRCPEPSPESLAVALRELELIEEQIKGLLALGRGSAESSPESHGTIEALIDDVERTLSPTCRHLDVNFRVQANVTGELGNISGLRAALVNLCLNGAEAVRHVGQEGMVVLEVDRQDGMIVFRVSDTGPGPTPEVADTLFDPFVTTKPEGTGLGLALARRVAVESGGSLTWRREPNRTVFELTIPQVDHGSHSHRG